ncbi:putative pentatricopeptide repeat-containing protein [Ananas comosus]|uniref:Putative pentatricopeptide repeat-containing protein n=1 Tax=Ananas comosus TaxID=4615 RepID=A0A199VIW1_ANACO|nr:putative pentatricopeptide repeat-containing protein [Ananas comosus]
MPERNTITWVEMIGGYAALGKMDAARRLLKCVKRMARPIGDVASWNAMISAYSNAGFRGEALDLFKLMLSGHGGGKVEPNHSTIATLFRLCTIRVSQFGQLDSRLRRPMWEQTIEQSHCGRPHRSAFKWKHKDLICYSSMIAGVRHHGCGIDAIKTCEVGIEPDSICFVSVLTLVATLVDRCIDEAYRLITNEMPLGVRPNAGVWGALLSACRTYSNVEVAEEAARHLMELEPENAGNYVLLSNIYAKAWRWDEAARVRARMRGGDEEATGWSWARWEVVRRGSS